MIVLPKILATAFKKRSVKTVAVIRVTREKYIPIPMSLSRLSFPLSAMLAFQSATRIASTSEEHFKIGMRAHAYTGPRGKEDR